MSPQAEASKVTGTATVAARIGSASAIIFDELGGDGSNSDTTINEEDGDNVCTYQ